MEFVKATIVKDEKHINFWYPVFTNKELRKIIKASEDTAKNGKDGQLEKSIAEMLLNWKERLELEE